MRRKSIRRLRLLLAAAAVLGGFAFLRARFEPIVRELAATEMDSVISTLMNDAIDDQIAAGVIQYDRMVFFEKDVDGNLTALRTNMSEINHLKTQIVQKINERLGSLTASELGVPLGNVLLPEFFSGQGPEVPVQLLSIGTSGAEFENQFSEAGINQTLHRILLTAVVSCTVLIPGGTMSLDVRTQVVVAETIVVGLVPQNYVTIHGNIANEGD